MFVPGVECKRFYFAADLDADSRAPGRLVSDSGPEKCSPRTRAIYVDAARVFVTASTSVYGEIAVRRARPRAINVTPTAPRLVPPVLRIIKGILYTISPGGFLEIISRGERGNEERGSRSFSFGVTQRNWFVWSPSG